jgi:type II secretion system protein J
MTASWHRRDAFTLLEVLVALGLMSIMAVSLYASLHIGFAARRSAEAAIRPVRRASLGLEMVRADLQSAMPPVGILAGQFIGQDLAGDNGHDSDSLVLYAATSVAPAVTAECGVRKVEFALSSSSADTEPALVRRVTTRLLAPETPEPVEEVLCRRVVSFNLRYFDGVNWLNSWDSTTQSNVLPLAVEVTLEMKREARGQADAGNYRLTRVFLMPCGRTASDEEAASQAAPG